MRMSVARLGVRVGQGAVDGIVGMGLLKGGGGS